MVEVFHLGLDAQELTVSFFFLALARNSKKKTTNSRALVLQLFGAREATGIDCNALNKGFLSY